MAYDLHRPKDRAKYRKALFKRRDKFFDPSTRLVADAFQQIGKNVVAAVNSGDKVSADKVRDAIQESKPILKKAVTKVWNMVGSDGYEFAARNFGGTLYGTAPTKHDPFYTLTDTKPWLFHTNLGAADYQKQEIPAWLVYVANFMQSGRVGDRRIDGMSHETEQRVNNALFAGMEQEEGQPQLAARVRDLFDDMSEGRARVIAKSESVDAYNQATLQQGRDAGSRLWLMWIATGDDLTRPEHEAMDGKTVPPDEEFDCEDGTTMPGEAVNCRCALGYAEPTEEDLAEHEGAAAAEPETDYPDDGFKDVDQIESWLTENGYVKTATLDELDPDVANVVADELVDFLNSNKWKYENMIDTLKSDSTLSETTYMATHSTGTEKVLLINPAKSFEKWSLDWSEAQALIRSGKTPSNAMGFAPSDVDSIKWALDHEMAHERYRAGIMNLFNEHPLPGEVRPPFNEELHLAMKKWSAVYKSDRNDLIDNVRVAFWNDLNGNHLAQRVSEYAFQDEDEGFSEAVSLYYNGRKDLIPPKMLKVLETYWVKPGLL